MNIKDKAGNSPLDIAVEKNDKTIAALLIASSSNTNAGGWKSAVIACIARNSKKILAHILFLFSQKTSFESIQILLVNSKTNETLVKKGAESDESWIISLKDAIVEGKRNSKNKQKLTKFAIGFKNRVDYF